MTKTELLEAMRAGRAEWEALLAEVGEARMTQTGVEGEWSVKDIVAHVAWYERWTADQLAAAGRGEAPSAAEIETMVREGWADQDRRNALIYEEIRHLSPDEALRESSRAFQQLVEAVRALPEERLADDHWWTNGTALLGVIPAQCYEHYEQHEPSIRAWLKRHDA